MSATLTPSSAGPSVGQQPGRSVSPAVLRPVLIGLALFVGAAGACLAVTLVTGATVVFNVLVFALFTVLWVAFGAALAFTPRTLHDIWHAVRALPLLIQGVVWLLFLPITLGLWIWGRTWNVPIRVLLVLALAICNVFMFVPR